MHALGVIYRMYQNFEIKALAVFGGKLFVITIGQLKTELPVVSN